MTEVGIRALKQNASAVVARAAAGESLTITDRGRAVARLTPLQGTVVARLVAAGRARPPLRPIADLPESAGSGDISESLRELREGERY